MLEVAAAAGGGGGVAVAAVSVRFPPLSLFRGGARAHFSNTHTAFFEQCYI